MTELLRWYRDAGADAEFAIVEGAGGWRVPLHPEGFLSDLPEQLGLGVVLVVGLRLGLHRGDSRRIDRQGLRPERHQDLAAGGPDPQAVAAHAAMPPRRLEEARQTVGVGVGRVDQEIAALRRRPGRVPRLLAGHVVPVDRVPIAFAKQHAILPLERTADGNSEVFISHRGMIEVYADSEKVTTRWQPRPADPELEAEMLQRLATRLNQPAGQATAARRPPAGSAGAATAAASTPETTRMVQSPDGRNVRLQVDENLDRAWRRVGLALDRGGFTVEDRDRARGFYLVRYLDPDYEAKQREKQGFFSRLFGGEAKVEAPQFRVQLTDAGNGRTDIAVLDKDGNPTIGSAVDRMLALLRDQLRT
jgi:hypothetical protein